MSRCRCLHAPSAEEHRQATLFVDVFKRPAGRRRALRRGTASAPELFNLLARFVGLRARERGIRRASPARGADADLVHFVENQLAGVIGAASAHIMLASVVKEEALTLDEVRAVLDEASQIVVYSHRLEQKSQELERATQELRAANERLTELDRMKDEFVSTVSHELRTPLTSIRSFTEILHDNPQLPAAERQRFLGIVIKETARLSRLIGQVLDVSRLESGPRRVARIAARHARGDRGHRGLDQPAVPRARRAARVQPAGPRAEGESRPRPHRAGGGEPAVQRGQVHRAGARPGGDRARRGGRLPARRRARQRPRHQPRAPGDDLREVPPGRRPARPASRRAAASGCTSAGASSSTRAGACG